jgi:hypothetical protein
VQGGHEGREGEVAPVEAEDAGVVLREGVEAQDALCVCVCCVVGGLVGGWVDPSVERGEGND